MPSRSALFTARAALIGALGLCASTAAAVDPAADYERSLAAVAEVDGVVMHLEGLAEKRRDRRPAEIQRCLDDKVAEARKLQTLAGQSHGRMVEAIADRKDKAAWTQYRAVVQVQAQARKLRGSAEVCRMLSTSDTERVASAAPAPAPRAAAAPPSPRAPAAASAHSTSSAPAAQGGVSAAVVGVIELELD
jgi:hypothetical protein